MAFLVSIGAISDLSAVCARKHLLKGVLGMELQRTLEVLGIVLIKLAMVKN